ncbi:NAD(P)-binding protein [Suhomyces tanzawaensis NRRL Y-17324]|uniref:NAD(P)-binding protein n=1 Tax=Suhomyces tanzawaensis NRRL Y-17324 TaxID=984487 RepID=A0A1E4SBE9_9ASCO|nr:NAD(P)-binding protein [Suhomyces tanzawaensis NRRL Y-17324]ODV76805.1 NAD(P)-binding protein [Suhomyces tanzawaensis NRRL Y-17324]
MPIEVFLTGATGYIGGEALYQLLNNQDGIEFHVTALVRSEEKGEKLKAAANKPSNTNNSKVTTAIGCLDDLDLIKELVSKNEVIINTANVDHVPSAKVLAEALHTSTTKKVLIHTSGTSVLGDSLSASKGPSTKVYSDSKDIDEINSLAPEQPHRPVDEIILDIHSHNEKVTTAIICPSNIVGISNGYDKIISVQSPFLIRLAKKNGKAVTSYSGEYIWSHIHIKDLGDLYYLILQKFLNGASIPANKEGYYFGAYALENEGTPTKEPSSIEHTWKQLSEYIGKSMHKRGLIGSAEVVAFEPEPLVKLSGDEFAPYYWGTNSRSRADNGYAIGWKPKYTSMEEYWKAIEQDIDYIESNNQW